MDIQTLVVCVLLYVTLVVLLLPAPSKQQQQQPNQQLFNPHDLSPVFAAIDEELEQNKQSLKKDKENSLNTLTIRELRQLARQQQIKGYSNMTKAKLIQQLA